ncbi:MAG TPA: thiamine pyrophosphate-binding protein [Gammaproteobacteria bacterium]|nr:thiamine pyrophosphate-binding protein [Gammaproteobacteria bacterium]
MFNIQPDQQVNMFAGAFGPCHRGRGRSHKYEHGAAGGMTTQSPFSAPPVAKSSLTLQRPDPLLIFDSKHACGKYTPMHHSESTETLANEALVSPAQDSFTGADLIIHYLEQLGVEYVFGIPGGGIEPFYDALARSQRRGGPRPVVARHEAGAAFMADGYARESGKIGVCCATTGPGATNMITGIASAYQDQIPLLAITAQTPLPTFGRGGVQESSCTGINTVAMYEHCTRFSSLVSHINQLERKLVSAVNAALHAPKGPAHISVPLDVFRRNITLEAPYSNLDSLMCNSNTVDENAVKQLLFALAAARFPVLVIGPRSRGAVEEILEVCHLFSAYIVATPQGKGLVNAYHPLFRGIFGLAGHSTAHELLLSRHIDLVVVIGSDLDELATNGWAPSGLLSSKSIFMDDSPESFSRAPMARQHIHGDIRAVMTRLLNQARAHSEQIRNARSNTVTAVNAEKIYNQPPKTPFERRTQDRRQSVQDTDYGIYGLARDRRRQDSNRRTNEGLPPVTRHFALSNEHKYFSNSIPYKPQRLMYDLSRRFPPNTRYIADIGNSFLWAIHYLHPYDRRNTVNNARRPEGGDVRLGMGFSSMGWAIGVAVGTAMCKPNGPVVCITGDGALLMSGQEITTAVTEKIPVIFVVLNDGALGTVKHGQQMAGAEPIAYELPSVDFCAYGKALGANAFRIDSPDEFIRLDMAAITRRQGPTILDIRIDPNEKPPLEERIKMLNKAKPKLKVKT